MQKWLQQQKFISKIHQLFSAVIKDHPISERKTKVYRNFKREKLCSNLYHKFHQLIRKHTRNEQEFNHRYI